MAPRCSHFRVLLHYHLDHSFKSVVAKSTGKTDPPALPKIL